MEKQEIEHIISRYFANEASPEELTSLKKWLDEDAYNLKLFFNLKNIWEASNPAFNLDTINSLGAYAKVSSKINFQPGKLKISLLQYWQRIAAVIVISLLAVSGYFFYEKQTYQAPAVVHQEVYTAYGSRSLLNLPDNSKVWLNAGSKFKFPTSFDGNERRVYLEGEAYFEVESDVDNPFIVQTNNLEVKSTGTKFNVEAIMGLAQTAVTLVDGKVNVIFDNNDRPLASGERVNYDNEKRTYKIEQTNTYKWCAWKDGIFAFRDDPLDYVFERVGQMYNIKFVIKDKEVAKYIYRATFEDESLEQILKLLELSAPINFRRKQGSKAYNTYYTQEEIEVYKSQKF